MLAEVSRALDALDVARTRVLVAVSGGVDSTVLAHALGKLAPERDLELALAHVNHGLRGDASLADAHAVEELAARMGVAFHVRHVVPDDLRSGVASRARPTLQEAARTLRREALREMQRAAAARHVATAHNADDQAETVLMRILRGCGPDGIGGIAERSDDGVFVRPLLGVARREIVAYALAHDLRWREDASNRDPRYTRSRVRADLVPALERDFNPQFLRVVGDLAEAHRRDAEWLETLVDTEAERCFLRVRESPKRSTKVSTKESTNLSTNLSTEESTKVSTKESTKESTGEATQIVDVGWSELPEALARRLVRRLLVDMGAGRDVSRVHLLRTLAFLREERRPGRGAPTLELPGGLRLLRTRDGFTLRRERS